MASALALGSAAWMFNHWQEKDVCAAEESRQYPVYRKADLQQHKTAEQRIWVAYKDGVYDITDFVKKHPGGSEKIMLGAGSSLEGFFAFYPFHQKDHV